MKTKILKIAAFLLILAGGSASCRDKEKVNDQNGEDTTITLSGTFVETCPISWVSCPEFAMKITIIDDEKLILKNRGANDDEFRYEIRDSSIVLTPMNTSYPIPSEYDFRIVDNRKFEIGPLYPHFADDTPPNMIFEKEN